MILYLHGFSSAGASAKAQQLRQLLAPVEVRSPTYPSHAPNEAVPELEAHLRACFPRGAARVIGSSLGGFYAQYLAAQHADARVVLINPALNPEVLRGAIGKNVNWVTGEPFEFMPDHCAALAHYDVSAESVAERCLVLLDAGDEVIDSRHAEAKYEAFGRVHVFPGGSHRFEHAPESVALIRTFFKL